MTEDLTGLYERWPAKAAENEAKWGQQSEATLLLAMQEELGELAEAHLDGESVQRRRAELDDLAALCIQYSRALNGEQ